MKREFFSDLGEKIKNFSSFSQISTVRFIYIATTLFLVALSVYTFVKVQNLIDSSDAVTHTKSVNESLQRISMSVAEAESNKRAYLLSGYSYLLEKRDHALLELNNEMDNLKELVKDNPDHDKNISELYAAIEKKTASIKDLDDIEIVFQPNDSIRANILEGVKTMASVRYSINLMGITEEELLNRRVKEYTFLSLITPASIVVLFVGALFILFISYIRINTALHESQDMQNEVLTLNQTFAFAEQISKYGSYRYNFTTKQVANSDNLYRLFGCEPQEFRGFDSFAPFIHPDDSEYFKQASEEALTKRQLNKWEYRVIRRDGKLVYIRATGKIIEEGGGDWLIGTLQDVTEEKEQEETLYRKNVELESKNEELENMNKELRLFAHISSHDLQEPLRKIQTFASRIVDKDFNTLSEAAKEHFKRLQEAAGRMQALIEDLLTFSQTSNEERKFEMTNLQDIVEEVKQELKENIEEKKAVVEVSGLGEINIIPLQFRQLLQNLMSNSLKFSRPDAPLKIKIASRIVRGGEIPAVIPIGKEKVQPDQVYCHISISDNGIGFEEQYKEKIFEVFHRLHAQDKYKGTGIGLAIVKKIVENHSGFISAKSYVNEGATFDIYIPAL